MAKKWAAQTYRDLSSADRRAVSARGASQPLEAKAVDHTQDAVKVRCPSCGGWAWDSSLIDLRGAPDFDEQWACDGCFTRWLRTSRIVAGAPLTKTRWLELLAAPAVAVERATRAERQRREINGDGSEEPANG